MASVGRLRGGQRHFAGADEPGWDAFRERHPEHSAGPGVYPAQDVFLGFSARTGGACENHDVLSFHFHGNYRKAGLGPPDECYLPSPFQVTLQVPANMPVDRTPDAITVMVQAQNGATLARGTIAFTNDFSQLSGVAVVTASSAPAAYNAPSSLPGSGDDLNP